MSTLKLAAAVILHRDTVPDAEVFLARRAETLRFFGGYWVFPGGNLSEQDGNAGRETEDEILRRCAARELHEEVGLTASDPAGLGATLQPVCRITTPAFFPTRYETQFYLRALRAGETPRIDGQELVDGRFFVPREVVAAWDRGEIIIAPPVLFLLRLIATWGIEHFTVHARRSAEQFEAGHLHPAYFSPGVLIAPLRTPTLPPATTTNTLIVGSRRLYVVDPATPEPDEQERLFRKLDELRDDGAELAGVLLTHHHIDHVGAVNAVSRRYDLPVHAHALTFERIEPGYRRGRSLQDGDTVELGTAPDGSSDWTLRVLHTPGHAVDHLCFIDSRYHAAVGGDMLSTVSTILIDPPEGHLATYLDSLRRLLREPMTTLYPAHGPAHRDGHSLIREFLEHRAQRERKILDALGRQPAALEQILPKAYADVAESVYPIAARALLAGLIKLEEDGRCRRSGDAWGL